MGGASRGRSGRLSGNIGDSDGIGGPGDVRGRGYCGTNDSLVDFVALFGAAIEAALRLVL